MFQLSLSADGFCKDSTTRVSLGVRMAALVMSVLYGSIPRGSIHTTILELAPQNHNRDGLLVPSSIMVVYMAPLGLSFAKVNPDPRVLQ